MRLHTPALVITLRSLRSLRFMPALFTRVFPARATPESQVASNWPVERYFITAYKPIKVCYRAYIEYAASSSFYLISNSSLEN